MKVSTVLLASLLVATNAFAQEALKADAVGAEQIGKKVAVEGYIYSDSVVDGAVHFYFGADNTTAFQAIVPGSAVYKFKVDIRKKFSKRNVRVTGTVQEQSGKYFVRVDDPSQLKVVPRKRGS